MSKTFGMTRGIVYSMAALCVTALPARSQQETAKQDLKVTEAVVVRAADAQKIPQPWGELTWYVSAELKNSATMTTGLATVLPGKSNPRHYHPNCDEVLTVLKGSVRHTMNDRTVVLNEGDTVSIPQGVRHNATNVGDVPALLAISFSSAWRVAVGE